jgi:hypothetical protein
MAGLRGGSSRRLLGGRSPALPGLPQSYRRAWADTGQMRTAGGWTVALLSIPFIGAAAWMLWLMLGALGPVDSLGYTQVISGTAYLIGFGCACLVALGVFGIVEFARRETAKWSAATIVGSFVWWPIVLLLIAPFLPARSGGG